MSFSMGITSLRLEIFHVVRGKSFMGTCRLSFCGTRFARAADQGFAWRSASHPRHNSRSPEGAIMVARNNGHGRPKRGSRGNVGGGTVVAPIAKLARDGAE